MTTWMDGSVMRMNGSLVFLYEGHDGFKSFLMDTDGTGYGMGWAASAWVTTGNEGRLFL
jgi:hypothetical protein